MILIIIRIMSMHLDTHHRKLVQVENHLVKVMQPLETIVPAQHQVVHPLHVHLLHVVNMNSLFHPDEILFIIIHVIILQYVTKDVLDQ
ncbi:unnamed protein product [Trichobilharzia regenti]|nr:unnamed protein product [Trichobilharzia regenti]